MTTGAPGRLFHFPRAGTPPAEGRREELLAASQIVSAKL
jgi:hypothetical protein